MKIVLDSGILGLVSNPNRSPEAMACEEWLDKHFELEHEIAIPAIIDYEIRRELIRANKQRGIDRLNFLESAFTFLEIDTATLFKAAEFWADARKRGQPTAEDASLDIDVILAAQAWMFSEENEYVVIATLNRKHLTQFVPAEHWRDIHPI